MTMNKTHLFSFETLRLNHHYSPIKVSAIYLKLILVQLSVCLFLSCQREDLVALTINRFLSITFNASGPALLI